MPVAGTLGNIKGIVNQSELSIIEIKTLMNLAHATLGLVRSATPTNPQVVAQGGTATFRIVKLIQFGSYTKANRMDLGDLPKSEIKVKIDKGLETKAKYEIESLDLKGLAFGSREAFLSYVSSGINTSMEALLDAHYLDIFYQDAKKKQKANLNTNQIVNNADFLDLDTNTKRINAFRQIARTKTAISRVLTKYEVGTNRAEYNVILHEYITTDLLLAMPKGGDTATAVGRELTELSTKVAGLGEVRDHVYLGQNIPAGTTFSKDTNFYFEKVAGVIAHQESAFLAIQGYSVVARINGAGNQEYIIKFALFKGMVRDKLYKLFTTGSLQ